MWQNKLMRKIVFILLLSLANAAYALPNCPSNTSMTWNNCFGTYTYANGAKSVGYYKNNKYLPDVCEDMGFRKGTSEFGQCILKLIDKI